MVAIVATRVPGVLRHLLGCASPPGPVDGRHRQQRRADKECDEQPGPQAGSDSVGAAPQRIAVQSEPADDPLRPPHPRHLLLRSSLSWSGSAPFTAVFLFNEAVAGTDPAVA